MLEDHSIVLEFFGPSGTRLGAVNSAADWQPAIEWARLQAMRRGWTPDRAWSQADVLPLWDESGRPRLSGFCVRVGAGEKSCSVFNIDYWRDEAAAVSSRFVETGNLKAGDQFYYRVLAPEKPSGAAAGVGRRQMRVQDAPPDVPIREGRLDTALEGATPSGDITELDIPVFIPRLVLAECAALMQHSGPLETGGALAGHLCRDAATGELYVEVTAQISALHTVNTGTRITFTEDTWEHFNSTLERRARGESAVAWWHTHPVRFWSANERDARGTGAPAGSLDGKAFFSADDCALHRTVFPAAHSIALLLSDYPLPGGAWSTAAVVFGWRRGTIQHRHFFRTGAVPDARGPAAPHDQRRA